MQPNYQDFNSTLSIASHSIFIAGRWLGVILIALKKIIGNYFCNVYNNNYYYFKTKMMWLAYRFWIERGWSSMHHNAQVRCDLAARRKVLRLKDRVLRIGGQISPLWTLVPRLTTQRAPNLKCKSIIFFSFNMTSTITIIFQTQNHYMYVYVQYSQIKCVVTVWIRLSK